MAVKKKNSSAKAPAKSGASLSKSDVKSDKKKKPTQSVKASAKVQKAAPKAAAAPKAETVAAKAPATKAISPELERKAKADEAVKAALATSKKMKEAEEPSEDEEFDAEAFFAASGGQGLFQAHVMRKERVDVNIDIRFRIMEKGPLVHHSELINLSKTGLCLRTKEIFKNKTILKIEIPLPHTAELFSVQAEVIWSQKVTGADYGNGTHTGLVFLPMNQAKQAEINNFITERRDEIIMAKIGLDKFRDSVPVAGLD